MAEKGLLHSRLTVASDEGAAGGVRSRFIALVLLAIASGAGFSAEPQGRDLGEILVRINTVEPDLSTPDDGYWEWIDDYVEHFEFYRNEIDAIRFDLSDLAAQAKRLRARWTALFASEYKTYEASPEGEYGVFDWLTEIAEEMWGPELLLGERVDTTSQTAITDTALEENRAERDQIKENLDEIKARQGELIDEGMRRLEGVIRNVRDHRDEFAEPRRQLVIAELASLEAHRRILEIELYDNARWYREDELPQLIKLLNVEIVDDPESALLLRAKGRLAGAGTLEDRLFRAQLLPANRGYNPDLMDEIRVARLRALVDLRELVDRNPNHVEGLELLRQQELYWLRLIARKQQKAAEQNLGGFVAYLQNRGLSTSGSDSWPSWIWDHAAAVYNMGPIGLAAGLEWFGDVPGAIATEVGVNADQAARNQIAISAVIRLVTRGVRLTDVQGLSVDDLAERITLNRVDGARLEQQKAKVLLSDIRMTARDLPDLERLMGPYDDSFDFAWDMSEALAREYFDAIDSGYHSYEWFGDILNGHALLTFWIPNGITASIGNSWGYVSMAEAAAARANNLTVGGRFFQMTGLERFGQILASSRTGQVFQNAAAMDHRIVAGLGEAARTAWRNGARTSAVLQGTVYAANQASRFAATMTLMVGASAIAYEAEAAGIPGAMFLVEMILSYEVPERLFGVLAGANIPASTLARRVDDLLDDLSREEARLSRSSRLLRDLEDGSPESLDLPTTRSASGDADGALGRAETVSADGDEALGRAETLSADADDALGRAETVGADADDALGRAETVGAEADDALGRAETVGADQDALGRAETVSAEDDSLGRARTVSADDAALAAARTISASSDDALGRAATVGAEADEALARATTVSQGRVPHSRSEAVEHAANQAAIAAAGGDVAEAGRASRAGQSYAEVVRERLQGLVERTREALRRLSGSASRSGANLGAGLAAPGTIADNAESLVGRRFFETQQYRGPAGATIADADFALWDDRLEDARNAYERALRTERSSLRPNSERIRFLEQRIAFTHNVELTRGLRAYGQEMSPSLQQLTAPISDDEMSWLRRQVELHNIVKLPGGRNDLLQVTCCPPGWEGPGTPGERLLVKILDNAVLAQAEAAGSAYANLVGVHSPGNRMWLERDGIPLTLSRIDRSTGEITSSRVDLHYATVMRPIDEFEELGNLHEHDLFAIREEYTNQRVVRAILGDTDGHDRNVLMDGYGNVIMIDTDFANIANTNVRQFGARNLPDDGAVMQAVVLASHGLVPDGMPDDAAAFVRTLATSPLYAPMARGDELIHSAHLASQFDRAESVNPAVLYERLVQAGLPDAVAEEFSARLVTRGQQAREALTAPGMFGNGPIQPSAHLNRPQPDRPLQVSPLAPTLQWSVPPIGLDWTAAPLQEAAP